MTEDTRTGRRWHRWRTATIALLGTTLLFAAIAAVEYADAKAAHRVADIERAKAKAKVASTDEKDGRLFKQALRRMDSLSTALRENTVVEGASRPEPAGSTLPDGRWYGSIRSVSTTKGAVIIDFDPIRLYVGDAAVEAARADGVALEGGSYPADRSRTTYRLTLPAGAPVVFADSHYAGAVFSMSMQGFFGSDIAEDERMRAALGRSGWWVTTHGGTATTLVQGYGQ